MAAFSLDNDPRIEVMIRLIAKGKDTPVTGSEYTVRLFDRDIFDNDYLGESTPDDQGIARIRFNRSAFSNIGNLESQPDFYFTVSHSGVRFFESKVMEDVDLEAIEKFVSGEGEVVDLGTFLIDLP